MRRLTSLLLAALASACVVVGGDSDKKDDHDDHGTPTFPMSWDFPAGTMERFSFEAGSPEHWRLSALRTPDRPDAPWKIVIVTGTPSWSEYWAPTIAKLGPNREIVVADRPGFAQSEPKTAVTDIAKQAEALSPLLEGRPGQRVLLVGQSFGAPISILMARAHPNQVQALVLMSAYFGKRGPTANRMYGVGRVIQFMLDRDLKNSISEIGAQPRQLPAVWTALSEVQAPVLFVHGDRDSFITLEAAEAVAERYRRPLTVIPNGDHFLNACCVDPLIASFEEAIAAAEAPAGAPAPGSAAALP
jgi:pimeloyl-ACP methyl ester carboxylesterase